MKCTGLTGLGMAGILLVSLAQARVTDPLTRARRAYNDHQFDSAISAAREALQAPSSANPAAVVLARAYLERFRAGSNPADLTGARTALAQVKPDLLAAGERGEFFVALGLSAFLDGCPEGCYSTAAEFFDLAMVGGGGSDAASRETIFEWWAGALDRQAQFGPAEDRLPIYRRLLERAEAERARNLDSMSAAYWIVAAARGVGDFNRAWGAAVAGWVRAKYLGAAGDPLRTEISRFVNEELLPERAKQLVPDADPRPLLEQLRKKWLETIDKYK